MFLTILDESLMTLGTGRTTDIFMEKETEEGLLEDKMPRNIGIDIEQDTTNIFKDLLNEAHNELYLDYSEFSSMNFLVKLMHVKEGPTDMRWYRDKRVETDDVLRHPTDAEGWKHFDCEFPNFSPNPRNDGVRRDIRHVPYGSVIDHYLGYETRFTRDERNDDTIPEDEVIGEFEIFKQKVRPLVKTFIFPTFTIAAVKSAFQRLRIYKNRHTDRGAFFNGGLVIATSSFTFHGDTIFALLDCSSSSPVYSPTGMFNDRNNNNNSSRVSLCDSSRGMPICGFLYGCKPIVSLNIPISGCCVYTPVNFGPSFEMDLEKLKCGSYSGFYSFNGRETDAESWKYGIAIKYKFAIDNVYPSWCSSCEQSGGVCGYSGPVGSFICNCPPGFNTTTNCFFGASFNGVSKFLPFQLPWSEESACTYVLKRETSFYSDLYWYPVGDGAGDGAGPDTVESGQSVPVAAGAGDTNICGGDVRKHSRLLELDFYVHANGRISMSIAPGAEEPILPHVVRFSQTIDMCVKKTFLVCCLRWAYVRREYIEVVKGDLQRFLFLISTITMDRFVENQVLNTFKEFRGDCYRHFKKYDPEEARANLPHILVGHMED
ncbi:wall-associated receptor kinase-like 10 [Cucumis melo var. makuwa]|uniref:Wall-associated receptor kinase-like 10 n=2 Tax=Cucumis melo TaxID=3656 RepID=A0A5A7VIM1_CUCMM|nr:wall-associated receptor kinase-like 10 [Cucumis melo var. makuwa]